MELEILLPQPLWGTAERLAGGAGLGGAVFGGHLGLGSPC
jgi:hypothetical protein